MTVTWVTQKPAAGEFNAFMIQRKFSTTHVSRRPGRSWRRRGTPGLALIFLGMQAWAAATTAPLLSGLASPAVPKASDRASAQRYFAQGMMLAWGFNPAEAARSFAAMASPQRPTRR